jgi:hypothetical protein
VTAKPSKGTIMASSPLARAALFTSVLALVAALGGGTYAAVKVGTAQLKNNAVTSAKIKNNTVAGKDVKESSLAKVPAAAQADSVGGLRVAKVSYDTQSTTPSVVFQGAGLTLTANCVGGGDPTLTATTSKQIYTSVVDLEDSLAPFNLDLEPGEFDTNTVFDLTAGTDAAQEDPALIQFGYDAPDGSIAFGHLSMEDACSVYGVVTFG